MANLIRGSSPLLKKIQDALGIKGAVSRIVIDLNVRDVATVYVQRYLDVCEVQPLCEALTDVDTPSIVEVKDVNLDEKGNIKCRRT